MINLTIPKCEGCHIVIPIYGFAGGKPTHCKECKLDTMIDIKTRKCSGCKLKQPVFGVKGTKKVMYCLDCKEDNMVDIRTSMCASCGVKQPFFGINGNKRATHCGDCKTEGMIDIKSKKCVVCQAKFPVYGVPGGSHTHCKDCKIQDHVDVKNHKCIGCNKKQPTYGDPITRKITHCKECKSDTYIDLKHTLCKSEHCTTRVHELCRGYCTWCFQHLFPDDPVSRTLHTKTYETAVAVELLAHDSSYKHDMPIFIGGCDCSVRRRNDFWKMIGNTIIAIEVDEHQHRGYDQNDEVIRYDDLYMGFSGKWIFIRFNPNSFRYDTGKLARVKLSERVAKLITVVQHHEIRALHSENENLLEIHKLFFNGWPAAHT